MRAAGIPTRRFIWPVAAFALLGLAGSAVMSVHLRPRAWREFYRIQNQRSSYLSADIQPRVFEEGFPNTILYVRDVIAGPVVRWRGVFLADLRSPQERSSVSVKSKVTGPRITVAEEAIAVPDPEKNQIQLHLIHGSTHEQSSDVTEHDDYTFNQTDQILDAAPAAVARARRPYQEVNTEELPYHARYSENWIEARIELYQRLALPVACLVLGLVGIPLGIGSHRSAKTTR